MKLATALALGAGLSAPAHADSLEQQFDRVLATQARTPAPAAKTQSMVAKSVPQAVKTQPLIARTIATRPLAASVKPFVASAVSASYASGLEAQVAQVAGHDQGRIGVAAVDLATGRTVSILGDMPFPMASTSKIAIAATFLDQVEQGKLRLDATYPLMVPQRSAKYSTAVAPVRPGTMLTGRYLIERAIINSDNQATDALLAAVGGTQAVNRWVRQTGITGFRLDRDIATLVRDDGEYDPARMIDQRDSATPLAMVRLLSGLYQGEWLSKSSRDVLIGAMERCATGKRRIKGMLPMDAMVAHKTGTLHNTSSDVGIIHAPDGRAMAVAIYVTGQGGKPARDERIAMIARALYDGYQVEASSLRRSASR